jgi:hypothetical protein
MNESKKTEAPKKRSWSVVRKAAFYGIAASILLTVGAGLYGGIYGLNFTSLPAHYLCRIFGYDPQEYHSGEGSLLVDMIFVPIFTNSILCFLIGMFFWSLFFRNKSK